MAFQQSNAIMTGSKLYLHGMMGRQIDPLWWLSYFSTIGITKAVVCAILFVGWCL